ncbi:HNH endonuclease signature motif containing protein [Flexivirga alba]|uniref:HNH endonuclease signature motif containing protein n=1 Tax=Flexivirga alba TaxID=702742 RepID=A0ABW2AKS4_9MICO
MDGTSADGAPGQGATSPAGDKVDEALNLLLTAFQDARVDSITLTKQELLEQAVAAQRVLNAAWALQASRLAEAAAIEEIVRPDATSPTGCRTHEVRHAIGAHKDEFIGCEVGPMLGWTSGQASARVAEATDAIKRTPRLFLRVGTGELEPAKLAGIHRALGRVEREINDDGTPATLDLAREVENALLGDPNDENAAGAEQANIDLLARSSSTRVQRRTQQLLAGLDPVADHKAADRRRRGRVGVFAHPDDEPGLTHLHAILPSAVAAKMMAAINKHAKDLHTDTETNKTLSECRADAITDLILGNARVTTELVVQVPVHVGADAPAARRAAAAASAFHRTDDDGAPRWPDAFAHPITGLAVFPNGQPAASAPATMRSQDAIDREFNDLLKRQYPPNLDDFAEWELDDEYAPSDLPPPDAEMWRAATVFGRSPDPASQPPAPSAKVGDAIVPGVGVIPAGVIEAISRSFGITITRALVDAATGVTVETCETQYRPSPRLRHFVETRDVHCRFPGCSRASRWCDVEHVVPWPEGPTAAYNLQCLCRHHHRTKQAHGWSVSMTPDGVCTWTSPGGREYVTTPGE